MTIFCVSHDTTCGVALDLQKVCHSVHAGMACVMYGTMGIFGAARFGQATEGDCLVNTWLGGRREGWIDLAMALYLSISIPPMQVRSKISCTGPGNGVKGPSRCFVSPAALYLALPGRRVTRECNMGTF